MSKINKTKEKVNEKFFFNNDNNKSDSFDDEYDLSFMDQFRFIDGRRFHNENSRYLFPNDKMELDRLSIQHHIFRNIWQGNFSSPVEKRLSNGGARVLDVGCGSGTWVYEMAKNHASSTFLGVDISPVFKPLESEHRNNVTNVGFLQRNVLEGLPFPADTFDFVYQRFLAFAFSADDWVRDINELVRVTKSGGWIELMEAKYPLKNKGPATKKLTDAIHSLHQTKNVATKTQRPDLIKLLNDTNQITDLLLIEKSAPIGKWGGRTGELLAYDTNVVMNSFKKHMDAHLGDDNFEELLAEHNVQLSEYKTYLISQRFFCRKL